MALNMKEDEIIFIRADGDLDHNDESFLDLSVFLKTVGDKNNSKLYYLRVIGYPFEDGGMFYRVDTETQQVWVATDYCEWKEKIDKDGEVIAEDVETSSVESEILSSLWELQEKYVVHISTIDEDSDEDYWCVKEEIIDQMEIGVDDDGHEDNTLLFKLSIDDWNDSCMVLENAIESIVDAGRWYPQLGLGSGYC